MLATDSQSSAGDRAEPMAEPIVWSGFKPSRSALIAAILLFFIALCVGCSSANMIRSGSVSQSSSGSGTGSGSQSGSGSSSAGSGSGAAQTPLALSPASTTVQAWQTIQFSLSGQSSDATCTWTTSSAAILAPVGPEEFQGRQAGNATISVSCGTQSTQAIVTVIQQAASGPITITAGGAYSGSWISNDPNTPAITIATDDPVTIQDSTISGRGTLIRVSGVSTGANVTIENVTGTGLDPEVAGAERGAFVFATKINSLIVRNCTMTGVSFGVDAASSTVSTLQILNNKAINLEDRASDGQGGFEAKEPYPGHFVILNSIAAPKGAEIGWNQVVQTPGQSSTTDVINIYRSQGSASQPIRVHDNYIEGDSSPLAPTGFSGVAIIADGAKAAPVTAFARFENNEVVHTAGTGIAIANGHDVTVTGNRVVSCGQDASGHWFAASFALGVYLWDAYGSGPSRYYNNTVTGTAGGLVRPNASGSPMAADAWASGLSVTYPGNWMAGDDFTDPCFVNGQLNLAAEDAERNYWTTKVTNAGEQIGDQHNIGQ